MKHTGTHLQLASGWFQTCRHAVAQPKEEAATLGGKCPCWSSCSLHLQGKCWLISRRRLLRQANLCEKESETFPMFTTYYPKRVTITTVRKICVYFHWLHQPGAFQCGEKWGTITLLGNIWAEWWTGVEGYKGNLALGYQWLNYLPF